MFPSILVLFPFLYYDSDLHPSEFKLGTIYIKAEPLSLQAWTFLSHSHLEYIQTPQVHQDHMILTEPLIRLDARHHLWQLWLWPKLRPLLVVGDLWITIPSSLTNSHYDLKQNIANICENRATLNPNDNLIIWQVYIRAYRSTSRHDVNRKH